MKIKTVLALIALLLTPTLSLAQGCSDDQKEANMTCAEGTAWDVQSKSCVASTS